MIVKTRGTTKKNEAGEEIKGRQVTTNFDPGANLAEAVAKYGEAVVYSSYVAKLTLAIHAEVRPLIDEGKTDEEIAAAIAAWKPGTVTPRTKKDPKAAFLEDFLKADKETQAKMIEDLKAKAKAAQAGK